MAASPASPDEDALTRAILARCAAPEDGQIAALLRESLRGRREVARQVLRRPEVKQALSLHVSATRDAWHPLTALLLRTLRQADAGVAAEIVAACDVTALARTLSYVVDYTPQQANLLARLYACNPRVGGRVFGRCGALLKEYLAQSSFSYLDPPEEFVTDVEQWRSQR